MKTTALYEHYRNEPFPVALALPSAALALIAIVGICLNSAVVYVTARSKQLRGTCHWLLALASLFEVCHQASHFVYFYNVWFGSTFIEYTQCVRVQTVPTFGLNALQMTLLSTAVDRLIAIHAPILFNSTRRKKLYLGAFSGAIFGYGLGSAGYFLWRVQTSPDYNNPRADGQKILVVCDINDTFYDAALHSYFLWNTLALNFLSAVLYIFVWLGVRKNVQESDIQRRLLKSLIVIVVVNVGGYFLNLGVMFVCGMFLIWPWPWYQTELNGVLLNLAAAANAPILYWMSGDYRQAFNVYLFGALRTMLSRCSSLILNIHQQYTASVSPSGGNLNTAAIRSF